MFGHIQVVGASIRKIVDTKCIKIWNNCSLLVQIGSKIGFTVNNVISQHNASQKPKVEKLIGPCLMVCSVLQCLKFSVLIQFVILCYFVNVQDLNFVVPWHHGSCDLLLNYCCYRQVCFRGCLQFGSDALRTGVIFYYSYRGWRSSNSVFGPYENSFPRVTGREPITSHRLNLGCRRVRE